MILWQKFASADWLAANQRRLEEIAGRNLTCIARPDRPRISIEVACPHRAHAAQLIRAFGGRSKSLLPNWWKPSSLHPPIRIGRRLEIVSKPSRFPQRSATLLIPAAGAFGTGEHSTTAMSLRLLEAATRKFSTGWRLLDAGTGTGILALTARKLGAAATLGLDNDPRAIMHARQNARLNSITRARFVVGDILQFKPTERYDVVTANLFSELLIAALPIFRRTLRPEGLLILSGILREQQCSVLRALDRAGFELEEKRRRGKWGALQARWKKARSGGLRPPSRGVAKDRRRN